MAANPKSPVAPGPVLERYHVYHAEAHVLSGNLKHPINQPIEHHARVVLEKTRRDGHIRQSVEETTLEGLISFKAGHTRASGTKIEKKDLWGNDHSGWVTLSTSVIEGLNVFEVITADRMVAQVSTEHAMIERPCSQGDVSRHALRKLAGGRIPGPDRTRFRILRRQTGRRPSVSARPRLP